MLVVRKPMAVLDPESHLQFCALEYRPLDLPEFLDGPILLIAVKDSNGILTVALNPELYTFVHERERVHILQLLYGLPRFANVESEALFEYLCSIDAEPIRTAEFGSSLFEHAE